MCRSDSLPRGYVRFEGLSKSLERRDTEAVSATSSQSVGDLRRRTWHSIRFVIVGGGVALALGVLLAQVGPGVPLEQGPILLLLVLLPAAVAALIEWRYEGRADARAGRPPAEAVNGD